jgi:hypothetical protein
VLPSLRSTDRVAQYSKFVQYDFPPVWLEFLIESALRFPDEALWQHPLPDPDDACFLSWQRRPAHGSLRGISSTIPLNRETAPLFVPQRSTWPCWMNLLNKSNRSMLPDSGRCLDYRFFDASYPTSRVARFGHFLLQNISEHHEPNGVLHRYLALKKLVNWIAGIDCGCRGLRRQRVRRLGPRVDCAHHRW